MLTYYIKKVLRKSLSSKGRAGRAEYWTAYFFSLGIVFLLYAGFLWVEKNYPHYKHEAALAFAVPTVYFWLLLLFVSVRRAHDLGYTAAEMYFPSLTRRLRPFFFLYWDMAFSAGEPGPNPFGEPPEWEDSGLQGPRRFNGAHGVYNPQKDRDFPDVWNG